MRMKSISFNGSARRDFLLVLDRGDDVVESLLAFAREHGIAGASLQAIGAFSRAAVAYWNPQTKVYEEIAVDEQVEVLSLLGSLAMSPDGVRVHAHAVLGRRDGSTVGGHLLRATVFPTLEVFIAESGTRIRRERDAETGLMLLTV